MSEFVALTVSADWTTETITESSTKRLYILFAKTATLLCSRSKTVSRVGLINDTATTWAEARLAQFVDEPY